MFDSITSVFNYFDSLGCDIDLERNSWSSDPWQIRLTAKAESTKVEVFETGTDYGEVLRTAAAKLRAAISSGLPALAGPTIDA